MSVCHLEALESLTEVLESDERDRPGVILIGSFSCPLYAHLQPRVEAMAHALPQFAFYDFVVHHGERPIQNRELARIIARWRINPLLSQILLPSIGTPHTISTSQPEKIRSALRRLY